MIWWEPGASVAAARDREAESRARYGEPPAPRLQYEKCGHGLELRTRLTAAAGKGSWEAGYIEAVFDVGETLRLLFDPRFERIWERIGKPPGPWQAPILTGR